MRMQNSFPAFIGFAGIVFVSFFYVQIGIFLSIFLGLLGLVLLLSAFIQEFRGKK